MANQYVIHPIPLVKIDGYAKSNMLYLVGQGEVITVGLYIWYIEGADKHILVDAGYIPGGPSSRGKHVYHQIQTVEEGLGKHGVGMDDIDILLITHVHHDHVKLAPEYSNALCVMQKAELEFAYQRHPVVAGEVDDPDYLRKLNLEIVDGDREICDGIKVLHTPGHTPGSQSIMVRTSQGNAIIAGFCSTRENFEPSSKIRERFRMVPCGVNVNNLEAYESMVRVRGAADLILPLHEAEFLNGKAIS